jgi:hypothetical protein
MQLDLDVPIPPLVFRIGYRQAELGLYAFWRCVARHPPPGLESLALGFSFYTIRTMIRACLLAFSEPIAPSVVSVPRSPTYLHPCSLATFRSST